MKRIFVTIIISSFFTNSALAFYPSYSSPSPIMPAASSYSNSENQSYNADETFKVSATDVQTEDSGVTPIPDWLVGKLANTYDWRASLAIIMSYIEMLFEQEKRKLEEKIKEKTIQKAKDLAPNTQRIITDIHYDGGAIVGQSTTIYGHFIDGNGNHIYVTATQE
ncbi:MAG: hypothetical protein ABIH76_03490, partial [Candidatus Bathyarchaeota archaeon]